MRKPVVSIIIPVFNSELYFDKCLDSVLSQSLSNIEIIIINDGSTDGSAKIAENRKKLDNRIEIVHLRRPLGAGVARNHGIRIAKGKWIAFLDSDDFYPNNRVLELLVDTAIKYDVTVCGGSLYTVDSLDRIISKCIKHQVFDKEGYIDYSNYQFEGGFYRFIYRADIIKNKIEFPNLKRYQDPPFLVKVLSSVKIFCTLTDYVYAYRKYKKIEINEKILLDIFTGIGDVYYIANKNHYNKLKQRMKYIFWKVFFNNTDVLLKSKSCLLHSLKISSSIYMQNNTKILKIR